MITMQALRHLNAERRATEKKIADIRSLAEKAGRELSDGDREDIADLEGVLAAVKRDIARGDEELVAIRSRGRERTVDPRGGGPTSIFDAPRESDEPHSVRRGIFAPRAGRGYRFAELFGTPGDSGFDSADEFMRLVGSGDFHPRLRAALGEGSGPSGGYAVPEMILGTWLDSSLELEVIRPRATIVTMTSDRMKVPAFDSSDHTSGTHGGISATWVPESGTMTAVDPKLRRIQLTARKLALLCKASSEILADGLDFQAQLERAMVEAVAWNLDDAFINGSGAGMPVGILNDPAKISVDAEIAQDADSVCYENLANMLGRLAPSSFNSAIWLASPSTIPQLLQLSLPIGIGGVFVPAMRETDGGFQILTKPVVFSEKMAALGDEGDIALVDLSRYMIGMRQMATLERSQHVFFSSDEVAFRCILRVDGQGTWAKAFTPAHGATQSWIVTLEART